MSHQNDSRVYGYVRCSTALQTEELSGQRRHLKQFAPWVRIVEEEGTQGWLSRLLKYVGRLLA